MASKKPRRVAKCNICKNNLNASWNYCPQCGGKTKEEEFEIKVDKIKYLLERQKGAGILYKNFKSTTQVGRFRLKKQEVIRPKLGDFININFSAIRIFSLLYQKPDYIDELYKVGKLIGYFGAVEALKQLNKEKYLNLPYDTDIFWEVISAKDIEHPHEKEWALVKEGILTFIEANREKNSIRYKLKESPMSVYSSEKPLCFFEVATLCGVIEALSNVYWTGREIKCECQKHDFCEFELSLLTEYSEPHIVQFSRTELLSLIDQCITNLLSPQNKSRPTLGDSINLIDDQVINYLLISPSIGHNILSKYSGNFTGEKIIAKNNINTLQEALNCLITLFNSWNVGLLHIESQKDNLIVLHMYESVYSSSVQNIHLKLDAYIAGIIEGTLKKATNQKWQVDETKCIANGDDYCEFNCKLR